MPSPSDTLFEEAHSFFSCNCCFHRNAGTIGAIAAGTVLVAAVSMEVTVSRSQTSLEESAIPMACPKNPMFKRGTTSLLLGVLTAHRVMADQV